MQRHRQADGTPLRIGDFPTAPPNRASHGSGAIVWVSREGVGIQAGILVVWVAVHGALLKDNAERPAVVVQVAVADEECAPHVVLRSAIAKCQIAEKVRGSVGLEIDSRLRGSAARHPCVEELAVFKQRVARRNHGTRLPIIIVERQVSKRATVAVFHIQTVAASERYLEPAYCEISGTVDADAFAIFAVGVDACVHVVMLSHPENGAVTVNSDVLCAERSASSARRIARVGAVVPRAEQAAEARWVPQRAEATCACLDYDAWLEDDASVAYVQEHTVVRPPCDPADAPREARVGNADEGRARVERCLQRVGAVGAIGAVRDELIVV